MSSNDFPTFDGLDKAGLDAHVFIGRDHDRLCHHPAIDWNFAADGVEEHVRVGGVGQGPVRERRYIGV